MGLSRFFFSSLPSNIFSTPDLRRKRLRFTSTRSHRPAAFSPGVSSPSGDDGTGPIPIMLGSTPATAHDAIDPQVSIPAPSRFFLSLLQPRPAPSTIPRITRGHDSVFLKEGAAEVFPKFHRRFRTPVIGPSLARMVFFPCFTSSTPADPP